MKEQLVEVEGLNHWFREAGHVHQVLDDVSMHLSAGEVVVLTGPSGSGKSTLLTIIGGLRSAMDGVVRTLDTDMVNATERQRVRLRRKVGFIFQQHNLAPALTVAQNIQLGLQLSGAHRDKGARALIERSAERVGLSDHLGKYPRQLSGGQQQRAGIARALVNEPKLVLADEPTASLDKASGKAVLDLFDELASRGSAVVLVTHDKRILEQADRILMLEEGRVVPAKDRLLQDTTSSVRTLMELDSKRFGRMLSFGHALARVALADGRVEDEERQAMRDALEAHEVFSGPEVSLVVELALAQARAWVTTVQDEDSRTRLADALRAVANADSVVSESERQIISELTGTLE